MQERPEAVIVTVRGEVDVATGPHLRAAVAAGYERAEDRVLVLDLTRVTFLGEAGLQVLVDAAVAACTERHAPALRVVVDHQRPVLRPLQLTGLDAFLALYTTVEDALAAS